MVRMSLCTSHPDPPMDMDSLFLKVQKVQPLLPQRLDEVLHIWGFMASGGETQLRLDLISRCPVKKRILGTHFSTI